MVSISLYMGSVKGWLGGVPLDPLFSSKGHCLEPFGGRGTPFSGSSSPQTESCGLSGLYED